MTITTYDCVGGHVRVELVADRTYKISATPASGYEFLGWTDGEQEPIRTYVHDTIDGHITRIDAIFGKTSILHQNDGHVAVIINDPTLPSFYFQAIPAEDATFSLWSSGDTNSQIVYVESDGDIVPYFNSSKRPLRVTTHPGPGGRCELLNTGEGTYCMTAIPNEGYTFWGWSDGDVNNPKCYTHPAGQTDYSTLFAVFTKDADIHQENGTTRVAVQDSSIPSFLLTADANDNATFHSWNNGVSSSSICYTEKEGKRIPLYGLSVSQLRITILDGNGGRIGVLPVSDSTFLMTASANQDYSFWGWTDGISPMINPREYTHRISSENIQTFHAVFTRDEDVHRPGGQTLVSVYNQDAPSFTLAAEADMNCGTDFFAWNNGSHETAISYSEKDGTRRPFFIHADNAVGYMANDASGGRIEVTKDSCGFALIPVANEGNIFVHWDDNSTDIPRYVEYNVGTYTATFSTANFKVHDELFVTLVDAAAFAKDTAVIGLIRNLDSVFAQTSIQLAGMGYSIGNLIIDRDAKVLIAGPTVVDTLVMNATLGHSSQLIGEDNLTNKCANFDIQLDPYHEYATPEQWYAFAVPFPVDVQNGINRKDRIAEVVLGRDYLVYEYDGDLRASTGSGWKSVQRGILLPGHFYMLAVADSNNIWRMQMTPKVHWMTSNQLPLHQFFTTSCKHRGWNGVANPLLYHVDANVESGIQIAQVYINGIAPARYDVKNLYESSFVVGSPFFIQASEDDILHFSDASHAELYSPKRRLAQGGYFKVALLDSARQETDVVYLTIDESAIEQYEFGKDVIKLGTNLAYPRISASAYGYNLCSQNVPIVDDEALVRLSLFIPQSGSFSLDLTERNVEEHMDIFLLRDGQRIWDLTQSAYEAYLARGSHSEYELLFLRHHSGTRSTSPIYDVPCRKYIQDGHLYIRVGDAIYDALGMTR